MDVDAITSAIKERIDHPFFGIFSIFFFIWNMEFVLLIVKGDLGVVPSIAYAKKEYLNAYSGLLYPLLSTTGYIVASQWIMLLIDKINDTPLRLRDDLQIDRIKRKIVVSEETLVAEKRLLTIEEEKSKVRSELHKSDLELHEENSNYLNAHEISQLKEQFEEGSVDRTFVERVKTYINLRDMGKIRFKSEDLDSAHETFVESLREIISVIESNFLYEKEYRVYSSSHAGNTKKVKSVIENLFKSYGLYARIINSYMT